MTHSNTRTWQIWIDTGGTFTDCLAKDPDGNLHRAKVLSSSALRGTIQGRLSETAFQLAHPWHIPNDFLRGFAFSLLDHPELSSQVTHYNAEKRVVEVDTPLPHFEPVDAAFEARSPEEAPILAARLVTRTRLDQPLPKIAMRLATTRGTNALLERKGARVALFITRGFGDLLRIGTQQRPDLFALEIVKPEPLYHAVVEVDERIAADGTVLRPLQLRDLAAHVEALAQQGIRSAAVALLHSYRNPRHEQMLAELLRDHGFVHISISSDLAGFIKIVPRAETTVVDAYLAPIIQDYLQRVQASLSTGSLHLMTSSGGLVAAHAFHAKDSLLSGPAGGVVGAAHAGRRSGFNRIIAFDMGGTSTDVARIDDDFEYVFEHRVGDAHLVAPALAIESVAAGGGSICWFDGYRLRVGPESAGADPGPACYGAGGPLTLTDINLLLGRLHPERFEIPISLPAAEQRLRELQKQITSATGQSTENAAFLHGFLTIADERMADAIRNVSVRKGYDPRDYVLVAFGGAGGQHACAVATHLGIRTIVVPPDTSLLSALGLGRAPVERFAERQVLAPLSEIEGKVPKIVHELAQQARTELAREGIPKQNVRVRRRLVHLRFVGQDSVLTVEYRKGRSLVSAFRRAYRELFGHLPEDRPIEVESVRVICSSAAGEDSGTIERPRSRRATPDTRVRAFFGTTRRWVPAFERTNLKPGARLVGPALIFEPHSTTVVHRNWEIRVDASGALILQKATRE